MPITKKHVEKWISKIVKEEVDKALVASNKRRDDFLQTFDQVFTEADAAAPAPPKPPAPTGGAPPAPGAPPPAAPGAPTTDAPEDPGALPPDPGGAPGGAGGAVGGPVDPNAPGGAGEEGMDDAGAAGDPGGGFGGFGGGGGGGGGGGMDGEPPPEADGEAGEAEAPEEPQGDPIESMVVGAQEMLNLTNDPNMILKSLKGQIQTVFKEPEHSLGLVKALYDTQDSILQSVAQRLYLFIKTARAK